MGKSTILIVDDEEMIKMTLRGVLTKEYEVLEAENGKEALQILYRDSSRISAIVLDIVMPVMDGMAFLEEFRKYPEYNSIPVIVATSNNDEELEKKCLEFGVWDFVMKPYNPLLLQFRLRNAIEKSRLLMSERDPVTDLYTKLKFFQKVREKLESVQGKKMAFVRFDIDRFKMINNFYGPNEGDRVLKCVASELRKVAVVFDDFVYGRIENDVFACCIPFEKENIDLLVKAIQIRLKKINNDYNIKASYGVYVIDNQNLDISEMYERAYIAAKSCKGNFAESVVYYNDSMIENMKYEQYMINQVNRAITEEQFVVYLQPKVDLRTGMAFGAEALVRWNHPQKGLLLPGDFIPVYERNGIIVRLDQYMWDKVCQLLRKWLNEGKMPKPVSVNVSRVNIYNPHLIEDFKNLIVKYQIPPELLNLELTESAFVEDQDLVMETMKKLHALGFRIMMDDFGSGYSSLNILKDMELDYLKIDMKFLQNQEGNDRGEKVLTSVIRMAKWLQIPSIVEGVETKEQAELLRDIGCEYAQGYYFAKPMTVEAYEELAEGKLLPVYHQQLKNYIDIDDIWDTVNGLTKIFEKILLPVALYEYSTQGVLSLGSNAVYTGLLDDRDLKLACQSTGKECKLEDVLSDIIKRNRSKKYVYRQDGAEYRFIPQIIGKYKEKVIFMILLVNVEEYS